jgi:hypothetical protein
MPPSPATRKGESVKKFLTLLGIVSVLGLGLVGSAAGTVTTNTIIPISFTTFVPCANGGAGEYVALSGYLHEVLSVTLDRSGGVHLTESYNPQGVTGTGLTTGAKYQGAGITRPITNITAPGGYTDTFEDIFRIIGQGSGNNLLVHENFHITVNPDGTVTTFHDTFSVTCV